jgi:carbonic anhydrase/acetyltransferase-like protein (isoleucine patch superfamily)
MFNVRCFEGRSPRIDPTAWIDPAALVIGDVTLGPGSSVWPMAVLRGDVQGIHVGAGSNIQDGAVLHVSHASRFTPGGRSLLVGEGVTVGHQAVLHACEVGASCLIGIGARVLDGAVIAPHSLLGAGALVPPHQRLDGGQLWVGAPVRRLRALSDDELAYLEYSAAHYVRLAERHRRALSGQGGG